MAYEDYEVSVAGGQPIELYALTLGSTTWRMHNTLEEEISYGGDTYYKAAVSRGNITGAQENLTITIPGSHAYSTNFSEVAPGQLSSLTIYRYHRAETGDVHLLYKGIVRSVSFATQGHSAQLTVIPLTATFDKTIPDRTFQAQCNNVLFDSDCQVSASSFKFTGPVASAASNTVTITGLSAAKGSAWATGGYVSYGILDFRLILDHTGDVLTLNIPFYEDVVGKSVNVYAGCDHNISTCNTKFSNSINFGGCPYVPTKNIFQTGL